MPRGIVEALDGLSEVVPEKCSLANGRWVAFCRRSTDFAYTCKVTDMLTEV